MKRTRKNMVRGLLVAGALALSLTPAGASDGGDLIVFGNNWLQVTICYDAKPKVGDPCPKGPVNQRVVFADVDLNP